MMYPTTRVKVIDGKVTVVRTHDAQDIVDSNKRAQAEAPHRSVEKSPILGMRKVGEIPPLMVEKFIKEDIGFEFVRMGAKERVEVLRGLLNRKLKDPDYKWFRTTHGQLR